MTCHQQATERGQRDFSGLPKNGDELRETDKTTGSKSGVGLSVCLFSPVGPRWGTSSSGCPRSHPHPLTRLWFSFHILEGGARRNSPLTVGAGHRSRGQQGGEETATLKRKRGGGKERDTHTQTETQRQTDTVPRQMNTQSQGRCDF